MTKFDPKSFSAHSEPKGVGVKPIDSAALRRLIEEVRATGATTPDTTAYNRTYHRHNR